MDSKVHQLGDEQQEASKKKAGFDDDYKRDQKKVEHSFKKREGKLIYFILSTD